MKPLGETKNWGTGICHPVPLGAALVMAINDHWLKGSGLVSSEITGKLSDCAGLFFFPALLVAVLHGLSVMLRGRPIKWRYTHLSAVALVGTGFVLANLWVPFNAVLRAVWMAKVMDPIDLIALPFIAVSWLWMERQYGKSFEKNQAA